MKLSIFALFSMIVILDNTYAKENSMIDYSETELRVTSCYTNFKGVKKCGEGSAIAPLCIICCFLCCIGICIGSQHRWKFGSQPIITSNDHHQPLIKPSHHGGTTFQSQPAAFGQQPMEGFQGQPAFG